LAEIALGAAASLVGVHGTASSTDRLYALRPGPL
jgi:hypothetical protein